MGGGDGMEHRNSTVLTEPARLGVPHEQMGVLNAAAHEFFHSWNVERIRPKSLEPFNFEEANKDMLARGAAIREQALRIGDIVRSAREFLRQGDTQLVPDRLPRLFTAVVDLMRDRAVRHDVQIATHADAGECALKGLSLSLWPGRAPSETRSPGRAPRPRRVRDIVAKAARSVR